MKGTTTMPPPIPINPASNPAPVPAANPRRINPRVLIAEAVGSSTLWSAWIWRAQREDVGDQRIEVLSGDRRHAHWIMCAAHDRAQMGLHDTQPRDSGKLGAPTIGLLSSSKAGADTCVPGFTW